MPVFSHDYDMSRYRPSHSPTWQGCCPGTLLCLLSVYGTVLYYLTLSYCLAASDSSLLSKHDGSCIQIIKQLCIFFTVCEVVCGQWWPPYSVLNYFFNNIFSKFSMFLVLIASIIPSQWWCVWASQQQSVSWSQSSASKLRWVFLFCTLCIIWYTVCMIESENNSCVSAFHAAGFTYLGLISCASPPSLTWHHTKASSLSSAWSCSSLDWYWHSSFHFNM